MYKKDFIIRLIQSFFEAILRINDNCQALRGKRLYLDRGTKTLDSIYEEGQNKIDSIINKASIECLVWESNVYQDAKHTENDWNERLDIPFRFLFEKN